MMTCWMGLLVCGTKSTEAVDGVGEGAAGGTAGAAEAGQETTSSAANVSAPAKHSRTMPTIAGRQS